MGSQKTKTKSQETATTTPNLNAAAPLVENYYTGLGNLSPDALKMPANDLQKGLYAEGMGLLGKTGLDTVAPAIGMLGGVQMANLTQAQTPAAYTPVNATAATATAPAAYTPAQASLAAYPTLAMASAPDMPDVAKVDASSILDGMSAAGFGGTRALGFINDYLNPYTEQVINATEADLRNSQGQDMASYVRQGALNGAFGGSGYALGKTNLIDAQNRTRNTMGANMRRQGWLDAAGLASGDADRFNSAGIASMQSANQFNSDKAKMALQAKLADAEAQNQFGIEGYRGLLDLAKTNTGYLNTAARDIFGAANDMSIENTRSVNDMLKAVFGEQAQTSRFNTEQFNNMADSNANRANDAARTQFTTQAETNRFNAGEANDTAQFNTNLGIDKAQTLGDLLTSAGTFDLNRLGAIGNIADSQAKIDYYNSPAGQAEIMYNLINGGGLLGAQTGQTVTGSKTSTSKESGGFLGDIMELAGKLGSAAIAASERRVKRDIVKLGEETDGLGVYRYNYVWDDPTELPRFGVMVDEVERLRPWALGPVVDGVQTVNYGAL